MQNLTSRHLRFFCACALVFFIELTCAAFYNWGDDDGSALSNQFPGQEQRLLKSLQDALLQSEQAAKRAKQPSLEQQMIRINEVLNWPTGRNHRAVSKLKEIGGIAFSNDGSLLIFHRGDRSWSPEIDIKKERRPISQDVILQVNASTGDMIRSWGAGQFYMPHGISTDRDGNIWLTDVITHQVYRYRKGVYDAPELVLGEKFVSGNDEEHFCMPTDVAVASNGYIYISDGYCNSRVVIVAPDGMVLGKIAHKEGMIIPHSLALLEHEDLLCVADRERMRILCFSAGLSEQEAGKLIFSIEHPSVKRVYGLTSIGDLIVAVNGPMITDNGQIRPSQDTPVGVVLDLATERMLTSFYPHSQFVAPHDIAFDSRTGQLFVVDLKGSKKLVKFQVN